jgi:hypothetical protein
VIEVVGVGEAKVPVDLIRSGSPEPRSLASWLIAIR